MNWVRVANTTLLWIACWWVVLTWQAHRHLNTWRSEAVDHIKAYLS